MDPDSLEQESLGTGNSREDVRRRFLNKAANLVRKFAPCVSPYLQYEANACLDYRVASSKLRNSNDYKQILDEELTSNHKRRYLKSRGVFCNACGASWLSQDRARCKIIPRPKTSRSVLRAMKRLNKQMQRNTRRVESKFQTNVVKHYFGQPSLMQYTCQTCNHRTKVAVDSRDSKTYQERHAQRNAAKKALKKAKKKAARSDNQSGSLDTSGYGSLSHSFGSTPGDRPRLDSSSTGSVFSLASNSTKNRREQKTASPMTTLKARADSTAQQKNQRQTFTPSRATSRDSKKIIKKLSQGTIAQMFKAQSDSSKGKSSLQDFLSSV